MKEFAAKVLKIKEEIAIPDNCEVWDDQGNVINTSKIIIREKKKEYPKTYEECCKILGFENTELVFGDDYSVINTTKEQWKRLGLMNQFNKLLICRDVYWKIAGEEMGLGKPWEPENPTKHYIFTIETCGDDIIKNSITSKWRNRILVFPTPKMRNAFKENFDADLEFCKKLL